MTEDRITVRFAAHDASGRAILTVAELGALMTGVSRSLNRICLNGIESPARPQDGNRFAIAYEPTLIGLNIVSLNAGSIILDAAITVIADQNAIREVGKTIILGILANAIYDQYGKKILLYDFGRAIKRVSKGAFGKTFELALQFRNRRIALHAVVSEHGKISVRTDHFPEDDVQ